MKSTIKLAFFCTPSEAISLEKKFNEEFDTNHTDFYTFHKGECFTEVSDAQNFVTTHNAPYILIDLYNRSEIDNIIINTDYKYAELPELSEVLNLNISIDKETHFGESKGIKFSLHHHEIAKDALSVCISPWGWQHTIKPWENESDLLKRIPAALQKDAFNSILTYMTYMDIEDVLAANEFNSDEHFNLLAVNVFSDDGYQEFMEYMVTENTYSKTAVRGYLQARFDAGKHINNVFETVKVKDYDELYPKGV